MKLKRKIIVIIGILIFSLLIFGLMNSVKASSEVSLHTISIEQPRKITTFHDRLYLMVGLGVTEAEYGGKLSVWLRLVNYETGEATAVAVNDIWGDPYILLDDDSVTNKEISPGKYYIDNVSIQVTGEFIKTYSKNPTGDDLQLNDDVDFYVVDDNKLFPDVENEKWYTDAVIFSKFNGLITGYTSGANKGKFGLNDSITRGQIATILYRRAGSPEIQDVLVNFSDVQDSSKYYYDAVNWASNNGIVTGYQSGPNAGKFLPNNNITREELAIMLQRYQTMVNGGSVNFDEKTLIYKDSGEVSNWAIGGMKWAVSLGIIKGNADGTLNPNGNATRAEAAVMLMRFLNNYENFNNIPNDWTEYWAPGLKIQYPTDWVRWEASSNPDSSEFFVNAFIQGCVIGRDSITNEIIKTPMTIYVYEQKFVTAETAEEAYAKFATMRGLSKYGIGYMTRKGDVWEQYKRDGWGDDRYYVNVSKLLGTNDYVVNFIEINLDDNAIYNSNLSSVINKVIFSLKMTSK